VILLSIFYSGSVSQSLAKDRFRTEIFGTAQKRAVARVVSFQLTNSFEPVTKNLLVFHSRIFSLKVSEQMTKAENLYRGVIKPTAFHPLIPTPSGEDDPFSRS